MADLTGGPDREGRPRARRHGRVRGGRPGIGGLMRALYLGFALYLIVPIVGLVLFAIATVWNRTVLPEGITFEYVVMAITDPLFLPTFGRSLVASVATIALSVALLTPTVYWLHVGAPRLRPVVEFLSLMPFAIPAVVLALSLIRTYSSPPLVLSGTPTLLVLAYGVTGLPYMFRALDNNLRAIDTVRLDEASTSLGASRAQTFRRVILPNIAPGITAGSLLTFGVSFGEYALASLLVGDAWKTSGIWTYDLYHDRPHLTMVLAFIALAVGWTVALVILFRLGRRAATGASGR